MVCYTKRVLARKAMLSYNFSGGESGGGGAGADFPKDMAEGAQGAVCQQWRASPGSFQVGGTSPQTESLMRSLCPEPNPNDPPINPPAPSPPFAGGQCCSTKYAVQGDLVGDPPYQDLGWYAEDTGKVLGSIGRQEGTSYVFYMQFADCSDC